MMISPAKVHSMLSSLISHSPSLGPHTALLITPQGELISSASLPPDYEGPEEEEEKDEPDYGLDEPYLDPPARLRLILGLASQWKEGESPKMECELGRLFFSFLPLPPADLPSATLVNSNLLPEVRPPKFDRFLLVLNGRGTGWDVLGNKADEFRKEWKV